MSDDPSNGAMCPIPEAVLPGAELATHVIDFIVATSSR
ncbi:MAG: hypothetical protein QOG98_3475 [Pseudonocardiales bacterium]|jgi:hypothetical protein|nr:hypothetical protein [Pseudonocardiales bacterium]